MGSDPDRKHHRAQAMGPLPSVSILRRIGRRVGFVGPLLVWCAAALGATWLYAVEETGNRAPGVAVPRVVRVASAASGRVATMSVVAGQLVEFGSEIGTLDASAVEGQLVRARARLERAHKEVEAAAEKARSEHEDRKTQFKARRLTYESEVRRQRELIEQLTAADGADRAEVLALAPQIERLRGMTAKNLVTSDRLDALQRNLAALEGAMVARVERLKSAREELSAWQGLEPPTPEDPDYTARLLPLRLQVEEEDARVRDLEREKAEHRVTAPVTGHVASLLHSPGEWCAAGESLVEIVVRNEVRLAAYVNASQAASLAPGTRVVLRPRDRRSNFQEGRVQSLGQRVDLLPSPLRQTPSIPEWGRVVWIDVSDPRDLVAGEVYDVRLP